MRGQIQIIIALVILLALITATVSYVTTINVVVNRNYYGYSLRDWVIIDEELDTLAMLALHLSSDEAAKTFYRVFTNNYVDVFIEYASGDYYYNFTASLYNFNTSLALASQEASWMLGNTSLKIINNWITLKSESGYIIRLIDLEPIYYVEFGMIDSTHITYGLGRIGITFSMDIITPTGDERVFNKSIIAVFYMEFNYGYPYSNIYLPIYAKAMIIQNGVKYYYMIPKESLELTMFSAIFPKLPSLGITTNYTTLKPITIFYHSNGTSFIMYEMKCTSGWDFANDIIYNLVYPTGVSEGKGKKAQHPKEIFLWASLTKAIIDDIEVYAPLKIVFKYNFTGSPHANWTLYIGVQGDENMPIPY